MEGEKIMKKVLSCILSILPIVMIAITFIVALVFLMIVGEGTLTTGQTIFMICLFAFELIGIALTFFMMVWYMIKTCRNPEFSTGMKVLWCALLYCVNLIAFPIYWFLYVRKE